MSASQSASGRYPIRAVAKLTGISIDTLRAWERRYGVVTPSRDRRGRLYTDADVARLRLIHLVVSAGHAVGRVADLDNEALQRLTEAAVAPRGVIAPVDTSALKAALLTLDSIEVDREASRLAAHLSPVELVRDALLPLLRDVGDHWDARRGGVALEHVMSSTLRHLFGSFLRFHGKRDTAIRLLFATPPGDQHEMGILAAAMLAAGQGFGVSYIGPNLPAHEIVGAVQAAAARVLVLGLTFASNNGTRRRDLRAILRGLPASVELWVGGRDAGEYADLIEPRGSWLRDFDSYQAQLVRLGASAS
jgi:DNA-binding transcriptional MerR regulator/methylmalonyl-CoA mutase cobalamin-binding subunit